jgi:hypothetical protein
MQGWLGVNIREQDSSNSGAQSFKEVAVEWLLSG